ncbi:MAG: hypothetical protein JRF15_09840 [Deltaproteobacteria bacterium]|jgi:hypothetical protein|nr:hypothetical protein [Deltaproteobacteria bacterium]
MTEYAYLASIFASAVYLYASVRLLRLNRRTGERAELLLGVYFALSGVYYLTYNLPSLLGLDSWSTTAEWTVEWLYILGVFPYLLFIRSAFRPRDTWAGVLVGACSIALLTGTVKGALDGREVYSLDNPWFLVQWVGYTAPCVWMCWEALLSRHGAQKRVRVGLCAPIVANRYLLFALFGGFQSLACLADLSYAADIGVDQTASLFSSALLGGAEIASVMVLWFAFFPPPFYSNWITQRAESLSTPVEG